MQLFSHMGFHAPSFLVEGAAILTFVKLSVSTDKEEYSKMVAKGWMEGANDERKSKRALPPTLGPNCSSLELSMPIHHENNQLSHVTFSYLQTPLSEDAESIKCSCFHK